MGRTSDAKQRLMDAVLDLVWKGSYGHTSVDLICEQAGVKKGSFYHFFESKSDLTAEALEDSWARVYRPMYDSIFSPSKSPLDRLKDHVENCYEEQKKEFDKCGRVLGCPLFSLGNEISMQEQRLREVVQNMLNIHVRYLETALRDGHSQGLFSCPHPTLMAHTLFRYCEGTLTEARIMNNLELLRDMGPAILGLLGLNDFSSVKLAA
ncbi:MAG: TetR family transcriptional regulator [Verrucomicrobiaceae bacterium]|nr:TetR family transcriptional regulator [Verrucomicrobiaceae bacterium]